MEDIEIESLEGFESLISSNGSGGVTEGSESDDSGDITEGSESDDSGGITEGSEGDDGSISDNGSISSSDEGSGPLGDVEDLEAVAAAVVLVLVLAVRERRLSRRYREPIPYARTGWCFDAVDDITAREVFRFNREEILLLTNRLEIGAISFRHRNTPQPELALCITLARLSYPKRWKDIIHHFGYSRSYCSGIFQDTVTHLMRTFSRVIEYHPMLEEYEKLRQYAEAIEANEPRTGGYIWSFIDGTFQGFCRPTEQQREYYSGHKKNHGMKFQGIATPDGLTPSLIGPWLGKENDWRIYQQSGVPERLRRATGSQRILYMYGDPAYNNAFGIMAPYHHPGGQRCLNRDEQQFNKDLSALRISVEQAFGHTQRYWRYNAFSKGLSIGNQAVAAYYSVATLFANCMTCLRGNQISSRFGIAPPTLDEYLLVADPTRRRW